MFTLAYAPRFLQSVKRCKKQGKDLELLWEAVGLLVETGQLPASYNPHPLQEEYHGYMECHIEDDWLLIWKQNDNKLTLVLFDTGSHTELFKKRLRPQKKK